MKHASLDFYGVRLEGERSLYRMPPVSELPSRASMIAELRQRVRAGTYRPNMNVVAERLIASVSR